MDRQLHPKVYLARVNDRKWELDVQRVWRAGCTKGVKKEIYWPLGYKKLMELWNLAKTRCSVWDAMYPNSWGVWMCDEMWNRNRNRCLKSEKANETLWWNHCLSAVCGGCVVALHRCARVPVPRPVQRVTSNAQVQWTCVVLLPTEHATHHCIHIPYIPYIPIPYWLQYSNLQEVEGSNFEFPYFEFPYWLQ